VPDLSDLPGFRDFEVLYSAATNAPSLVALVNLYEIGHKLMFTALQAEYIVTAVRELDAAVLEVEVEIYKDESKTQSRWEANKVTPIARPQWRGGRSGREVGEESWHFGVFDLTGRGDYSSLGRINKDGTSSVITLNPHAYKFYARIGRACVNIELKHTQRQQESEAQFKLINESDIEFVEGLAEKCLTKLERLGYTQPQSAE
jgi:hypothetical protein